MSKQEDWWPSSRAALLVVLGLATGTAVVQRSPGAPPRPSPAAASPADTPPTAHASGLTAAEHVIDLLADAVGVDRDGVQAREAATEWRDYLCLKTPAKPDRTHRRMMAALDAVVINLGGPSHAMTHPSSHLEEVPLDDALSVIRAHSAFEGGDSEVRKMRALVTDYFESSDPAETIASIERTVARRDMKVDFLIAMLPDYIDSQTRRLFDSSLTGIQQAAGALGYTLDRFHLPGWSAHDQAAAKTAAAHDSEPGALLFRYTPKEDARASDKPGTARDHDKFLVVLIVTEMPTLGVHRNALRSSVAVIDAWRIATNRRTIEQGVHVAGDEGATLNILGPFFSGSVPSLSDALQSLIDYAPRQPRSVRIVTGTATDPEIKKKLPKLHFGPRAVTFQALVPDNTAVRTALLNHLAKLNPDWQCRKGIALLVEGNTKFGQSIIEKDTIVEPKDACSEPLEVTFPLHVSRLRAAVDADAPAVPRLVAPAVKLKLTESTQPMDLIPSMTPELTASVVDSALDNLLSSLRRERFTAIGIFATDARDHLFLARRIAKTIPDVLMFGTQSDLLYVNPEYAPFLRGTVIASSYPVFNQTQLLMNGPIDKPRRQFTTASEQGLYNAAIALMPETPAARTKMVDAGFTSRCVGDKPCDPPVWLSVIGSNAIWPIAHSDPAIDRLLPQKGSGHRPVTSAPPSIVAPAIAVFGIALVHFFAWLVARQNHKSGAPSSAHRRHHSLGSRKEIAAAAQDLAATCHWHRSRVLWNLYPPSDLSRPAEDAGKRSRR